MKTNTIIKRLEHAVARLDEADNAAESGKVGESQIKLLVARNAIQDLIGILKFEAGETKTA